MSWASPIRVYLSRRRIAVEGSDSRDVYIHNAEFADVSASLAAVEDAGVKEGHRVEIYLSGGLCPAVTVDFPTGMSRYTDKDKFAKAVCASALEVQGNDLVVEFDGRATAVAAPIRIDDLDRIRGWASGRGARLGLIQPLWATLTHERPTRRARAVGLIETDAVTLLSEQGAGAIAGLSSRVSDEEARRQTRNRLAQALKVAGDEALWFEFGPAKEPSPPNGLKSWRTQWKAI